jgi:hypothetical protein
LVRRKAQADAAPLPGTAQWQRTAQVTAPWPTPPSSRTPAPAEVESADASTPFASAVDIFAEDSRPTETPELEPDFRASTNPWWRRLKAPSRQVRMGALIAGLAAAIGWSAGAKPWASHHAANKPVAAKSAAHQQQAKRSPTPAHGTQAAPHANRRVAAVNTKSKPAPAAAHPKASAKATTAAKPAAKTAAAHKLAANKAKPKAKSTTVTKKTGVAAKPKSVSAQGANKAKAHPAN